MGYTDYMKQGNDGKIHIDFSCVPDKVFIDANQIRGIYKARILSREQRKSQPAGSPDVVLTSATGGTQMISRDNLCKNYKHSSGKNITIAFLKTNTSYVVQGKSNDKYKIIKLPDNCIGNVKGNMAKPGSYIICKTDTSGNIIKDSMEIVSPKLFRKIFKIPMQSIIKRHMNGGANKMFGLFNSNKKKYNRPMPSTMPSIGNKLAKTPNESTLPVSKLQKDNTNINSQISAAKLTKQPENKYPFIATHRVVDMRNGKLKGFILLEKKTGRKESLDIPRVSQFCERKLVENLMLVTKEISGTRFLKGNGIRIESLPEVID